MPLQQYRPTGEAFEALLKAEQAQRHARVWPTAAAGSMGLAVVLSAWLWPSVSHTALLVWLTLLAAVLLWRTWIGLAHRKAIPGETPDEVWMQRHRIVSLLHGIVWALCSVMVFPIGNVTAQIFVVLSVAGICISSLSVYAFDLKAAMLFCVPNVVVLALRLITLEEEFSTSLGVMVAMFMAYVGVVGFRSHGSIRESVAMQGALAAEVEAVERSKQQLSRAEHLAHLGSFDWYPQNGELEWSDQHFRLWGLVPGSVKPSHALFLEGIHPDDRDRQEILLQSALRGEGEYECIYRVIWPDGSLHHVRGFGEVTFDAFGQALRMVGTVQDITSRTQSETALAEKHHVLTLLLQNTEQGFWFIDANGVTTDVNPALCELLGRSREDIVGHGVYEFFDGSDLQVLRDQVAARGLGQRGGMRSG